MGMTLRRIAAKCIMFNLNNFCAQEFRPSQLGVGTPKGAESAVHALRAYLNSESNKNKVVLKIDMNASSICLDKIFFVQDNIEIVHDKNFVHG